MAMTPADQRASDPASPAAIVTTYLTAYLSGEIATAQPPARDDFSFRAPLAETAGTKDVYFAGPDQKARYIRDFRILRQWQDADEVATVYEIGVQAPAGTASMFMHEWPSRRCTSTYSKTTSGRRRAIACLTIMACLVRHDAKGASRHGRGARP